MKFWNVLKIGWNWFGVVWLEEGNFKIFTALIYSLHFLFQELRKSYKENGTLQPEEQQRIFEEAMTIRLDQFRATDNTKSDEEHTVELLADLQDKQDKEAANVMKDLDQKVCFYDV